jgi:hypothetical protein
MVGILFSLSLSLSLSAAGVVAQRRNKQKTTARGLACCGCARLYKKVGRPPRRQSRFGLLFCPLFFLLISLLDDNERFYWLIEIVQSLSF